MAAADDRDDAGADRQQIEALLDEFERKGLLCDARAAEALVHAKAPRHGVRRLEQDLRARGLGDAVIAQALQHARGTELQRARAVWRKRFGRPPADAAERARQQRFLMVRGFSPETIWALWRAGDVAEGGAEYNERDSLDGDDPADGP